MAYLARPSFICSVSCTLSDFEASCRHSTQRSFKQAEKFPSSTQRTVDVHLPADVEHNGGPAGIAEEDKEHI